MAATVNEGGSGRKMSSNAGKQLRRRDAIVTCEICHVAKSGEDHFKRSWNSKTGYEYRCKQCTEESRLKAAEEQLRQRKEERKRCRESAGRELLFAFSLQTQHRAGVQFIYALVDPRTTAVHYVGRTGKPERRFRQHLYATRRNNFCTAEKEIWMRELRSLGLRPLMVIVETVKSPTRRTMEREHRWMFHYIQRGAPLTNWEAIGQPHLASAIWATTVDFLTLPLNSKSWLPLYHAARKDFEETESARNDSDIN